MSTNGAGEVDAQLAAFVQRFAKTRLLAQRATAANPNDERAAFGAGTAYLLTGDFAAALREFQRACQLQPGNPIFHYQLGTVQEYVGSFDDAARSYAQSVRVGPGYYKARLALVQLRTQTPDDNSISDLEALFGGHDEDGWRTLHIGHALAKTYEDLGELTKSFEWLGRAKARRKQLRPFSVAESAALAQASVASIDGQPDKTSGFASREPIFVCGLPRSGTTLIDRILSSHPQVSSAGEIGNFVHLLKRMVRAGGAAVSGSEALRSASAVNLARLGGLYVESTRPLTGHVAHFVDKAPSNYLYAGLILRALPNARVICLRRKPLDACLGNYRQIFPLGDPYHDYVYGLESVAHKYLEFDRVAAHWKSVLPPDRFMEMQYEDLVAHQEEQTKRLLRFCDLPWDERCLTFHENEIAVATPSAVQVRSGMNSGGVGRWRKYGPLLDPARDVLAAAGIRID